MPSSPRASCNWPRCRASVGGTKVKVSVTNTADQEVNVLKVNSFFDESPVPMVTIRNTGMLSAMSHFRC
jgi:hypothetical protein